MPRRTTDPYARLTHERQGALLRSIQRGRDMTAEALGQILGVSYQQVHRWEKGINGIGQHDLQLICDHFGVAPASFFKAPPEGEGAPVKEASATAAGLSDEAFAVAHRLDGPLLRYRAHFDGLTRDMAEAETAYH